jgi:small subunit ribosomal protein S20
MQSAELGAREVHPLAHSKSALKRWRQNEAHRERNQGVRSGARTAVKKAHTAIDGGSDDAQAAIREAASILDRASKGNVVHRNAVARHKSRMARHANKLAGASAAVAEAPKKARKAPAKKAAAPKAEKPKAEKAAKEKAPAKPRGKKADKA